MPTNEYQTLLQVVSDTNLPLAEQRDAALHLVQLRLAEAQTEIAADDPELVRLMRPWSRNTEVERWIADDFAKATNGRSLHGYTLTDAKVVVVKSRRRAILKAIIKNENEILVVRDAARGLLGNNSTTVRR